MGLKFSYLILRAFLLKLIDYDQLNSKFWKLVWKFKNWKIWKFKQFEKYENFKSLSHLNNFNIQK
jgi:hypothetical protein